MSNVSGFESIYIRDLDAYISIDAICVANAKETEDGALRQELERIGAIDLLADKSLSPHALHAHHISPEEWRWEVYRASRSLRTQKSWRTLEPLLVRGLLSVGRAYAIRRYARWEKLPLAAAMTATLPFGFRAVLSRFFEEETIHLNCSHAENIDTVLASATKAGHLTAYEKTALVQAEIHSIAQDIWGKNGAELLDRNRMRHILSLARLHFSVQEMKDGGFARFLALKSMYAEKQKFLLENDEGKCATRGAKIIRNWRIRHVRPLLFYYPFAVRAAIERGCLQCEMVNPSRLHERVANELALANLALSRLKRQD